METVYGYFEIPVLPNATRNKKNRGVGYICVRLDRPPKNSIDLTYRATLSFCSPLDQFSKKRGRMIADKRMEFSLHPELSKKKNAIKRNCIITVKYDSKPKLRDVMAKVIETAFIAKKGERSFIPRWLELSTDLAPKETAKVIVNA